MLIYYWPTPNTHKVVIFMEEAAVPYHLEAIDIFKGEQFAEAFLRVSPNSKVPALIDDDNHSGDSISIFESGAILIYLQKKYNLFGGKNDLENLEVMKWLFWQVSNLGPMAGQNHHFAHYAPEKIPYAINRYVKETNRLYNVLNKQLSKNKFVAGDYYSIADMAIYPWIHLYNKQQQDIKDFPNLEIWHSEVSKRPAVINAYKHADKFKTSATDEDRKRLYNI